MNNIESFLTEIRDLLAQLLELARAANPQAAKQLANPWEGVFKPIEGVSDGVTRWPAD